MMIGQKRFSPSLTLSVALSLGLALPAAPAHADRSVENSAGVNSSCEARQETFTIPAGSTGVRLGADFRSGQNCGSGGEPETSGWEISSGACGAGGRELEPGDVYRYWRTSRGNWGSSMRLDNLTLAPGVYCLSFNGGRWGYIKLNYTITP